MANQERLLAALTDFAHVLVRDYTVHDVIERLGDRVVDVLEVEGAGVTLRHGDETQYISATGPIIERIEQAQDRLREGPCMDAMDTREVLAVVDLREVARWPLYVPTVLEEGMRAVVGVPMGVGGEIIGALNIYHDRPRDWSEQDLTAAKSLADMASRYIALAQQLKSSRILAEQPQRAMDSRAVLEQAKGVLARAKSITPDEAFERLRKEAGSQHLKLHHLAAAVIEEHIRSLETAPRMRCTEPRRSAPSRVL